MTHHRPFFSFSPSFSSDFLSPSYSVDKNIDVQLPLSVDRETPETRSSVPTKFSRIFFLAKLATRPETARKKKSHRRCLLWCSFPLALTRLLRVLTKKSSTLRSIRNATRCLEMETLAGGRDTRLSSYRRYK